jgi:hypothetical protein
VRRKQIHPDKTIEEAIRHAEGHGWSWIKASGHAWGILRCPWNDEACRCGEFCQVSIWSTPRNAEAHARQIRRAVDKCIHLGGGDGETKEA